jgi:gluconolactonase
MNYWKCLIGSVALISHFSYAQLTPDTSVIGAHPNIERLISTKSKLELVKTGFGFTEGLTWVDSSKSGYLLFSDIPSNVIYKMTPQGELSVYLEKSGYTLPDVWRAGMAFTNGRDPSDPKFERFNMSGSNGLAMDMQGRLIIASWAGRSIDRIEKDGKRTKIAEEFGGRKFNGTNDVVVKKDGTIYFTETFGGLRLRDKDPKLGIDFQGVFMIKDGQVKLLIKDLPNPNGLVFSPDQKVLYANSGVNRFINRYEVREDGTLGDGKLLIDFNAEKAAGISDGMKVDSEGNLWSTGPGGVWIMSPEGQHLGTILVPELTANLVFGGTDRKTLYIAARSGIYKIQVNVAGLP